jgi:predicted CXXCH cytochrome family protein
LILPQAGFGESGVQPDWESVGPIFTKRCINCHAEHGAAKGLRLDSYKAAIAGSKKRPVLLPGDAKNSELVRRIRGESVPRMPFLSKSLPQNEIDAIIRWVEAGLPEFGLE